MCKICFEPHYYICKNCVLHLNSTQAGQSILHNSIYDFLHEISIQINGFKKHLKDLRINSIILSELEELNFECQGTYLFLNVIKTDLNFIELRTNFKQIVSIKNLSYGIKDIRRLVIFYSEINTALLEHVLTDLIDLKLSIKDLIYLIGPYLSVRLIRFNVLKELRSIDVYRWPVAIMF